MPEAMNDHVRSILLGLLWAGWLLFVAIMIWRGWRDRRRWREQTRHWQHQTRVNQRIQELLAQEYENRLTPEERQRREAQRRHLEGLRAQAEAELAAEEHEQKGRRHG